MADFDKNLVQEVTTGQKIAFIAYPWVLGILWFFAAVRAFFFLLHCTGSALQLFQHSFAGDCLITAILLLLPILLWLGKEFWAKRTLASGHTINQLWEAWQYADQHPAPPEENDRWGKKHGDSWIMIGSFIFLVLVVIFSIYGLS